MSVVHYKRFNMAHKPTITAANRKLNEQEQANEARHRDEQFWQQNDLLRQLLDRMNNLAPPTPQQAQDRPELNAQPTQGQHNPQAAAVLPPKENPIFAPKIEEPVYERFRRQKLPRFDGGMDAA